MGDAFRTLQARWRRWLGSPGAPEWVALVALLLSVPSVVLPPAVDDHGFRTRLLVEGKGPDGVFRWGDAPGEDSRLTGSSAWWSVPASQVHFFRPLSGLTHWLDYRLWPGAVWWMRLEGCLAYALLVWAASRAYRALSRGHDGDGEGHAAGPGAPEASAVTWGLAALLFAVDDAHAQSLAFVAGRNTLLSALFGLAALLAHHHGVGGRRAGPRLAAALCFALALASGEAGLAALGYLVAYAVVLDHRRVSERLIALAPYFGVALLWALVYVAGGYGARMPVLYRDVLGDPLGTLVAGVADLPIWIGAQLTVPFASPTMVFEPWMVRLAALPLALVLAALLWPTLRTHRLARFHSFGFILSLAPMLATWPQDRALVLPSFGAFGVLACFVARAQHAPRRAPRVARRVLLGLHLGIAPLSFVPSYMVAAGIARAEARVDSALPRGESARTLDVVVVRAPIVGTLPYALARRRSERRPVPRHHYELYAASRALVVSRPDVRTLELLPEGGYCASRVECLGGELGDRFAPGRVIELAAMRVEIVTVSARSAPLRVRFRFPTPLEDPSRRWLSWTPTGLEPFTLPAVGESRRLPALSGLSAFR